jgi:formylglycine-generating enzyme required for sulfatase activity
MLFAAYCMAARAETVNIALVPVGDAGNVSDPLTGYGSVGYSYSMGEYDVTMSQYTAFLNSVASSSDPYGLYNTSMATATPTYGITRTSTTTGFSYALASTASANVPVTFVNWGNAARFVNWLQNGEPSGAEGPGTTETGSYALNGSTGSAALAAVTRGSNANWILPNVNEWYKTAYYAGGGTNASYWQYPTQSNAAPSNVLSATGTNNANFTVTVNVPPFAISSDQTNWLTSVGAFADSPGPYGTFDQGGDVDQWTDTVFDSAYYKYRGGSWESDVSAQLYVTDGAIPATGEGPSLGFRVAYVPEPATAALLASVAVVGFLHLNHRRITASGSDSKSQI